MSFSAIMQGVQTAFKHNSPAILTGLAVAGTVTTGFFGVRAGFKASESIRQEEQRRDNPITGPTPLTAKEKVQICWPIFVPVVSVGTLTVACALGANHVSSRRVAALAGAYSLSESAFREYKDKVVEQIGVNKEQKVRDLVAQDQVTRSSGDMELVDIEGKVPCYDVMSGRYFLTTMEDLKKAQNDFNSKLIRDNYASLNEFWDMIGLTATSIGEELGWTVENLLDLHVTTTLTKDGKPCLSLGYTRGPVSEYWKFH